MVSTQPDAAELILRYLAGRLTPAERDAFERALPARPELREHAEQVLKLQEGLARLRERGELEPLLRARAPRRWLPYAAAAAVAALSLLAWAWFYLAGPSRLLALSPTQFVSSQHPPPPVIGSYVLARVRGGAAATELPRGGVIEIRALPSVLSSTVRYRARLVESGGTVVGRPTLGQVDAGRAAADGYVTFYVDAARLAPGDYEILLSPSVVAGPDAEADHFPIRVR